MPSLPTNSLGYRGVRAKSPTDSNAFFHRDPTPEDYRNHYIGDEVRNENTDTWWKYCGFDPVTLADWQKSAGPGSGIEEITTNSGSAIPDASNNVNVLGDSTTGTTTSASVSTVTVSNVLASNAEAIAGSVTNKLIVPSSLTAKLGAQTAKGLPYGAGSTAALAWTGALNNGQIVIGSTAGIPAAANITSTDGSVTITNGANSINLSTTNGTEDIEEILGNTGSATPNASGQVSVVGDTTTGVSTAGSGSTLTITNATASNAETIAGSITNKLVVPGGMTAKLGVQTAKGISYGTGTTAAIGWTGALSDGQLPIGSSSGNPAAANITSSNGSISITNGANSIDLATAGNFNFQAFTTNVNNTTETITTWTLGDYEWIYIKVIYFCNDIGVTNTNSGTIETQGYYSPVINSLQSSFTNQYGSTDPSLNSVINYPGTGTRIVELKATATSGLNVNYRHLVWYTRYTVS